MERERSMTHPIDIASMGRPARPENDGADDPGAPTITMVPNHRCSVRSLPSR